MKQQDSHHEIITPTGVLPVWLHVFDNEGAGTIPPHWHQSVELSYTQLGEIDHFYIEKRDYHPQSGDIVVVNSQQIHRIVVDNLDTQRRSLTVIFPYTEILKYFPAFDQFKIMINDSAHFSTVQQDAYHELCSMLDTMISLYRQTVRDDLEITIVALKVLHVLLKYFLVKRNDQINEQRKPFVIDRLQKITTFIDEHYQEKISLNEIANGVHISKEYLARFFKEHMGITVYCYLKSIRAQFAFKELISTRQTLTRVAMDNGFSGLRSMNRALEMLYHKDAKAIRNSHQEKIN